MLAPEQNTRSLPLVSTTMRTSGCSKRMRFNASWSSISTPEIVGIELQPVTGREPAFLVNLQRQGGNRAFTGEAPVAIADGFCVECGHRNYSAG